MEQKLPMGIQSFEKLRDDHFVYVDKTEYIYRLVHNNVPYFLSRPRRFGKSLLLSTLKAYWEGKKALFSGLSIEKLEEENPDAWQPFPVFFFDFNGANYLAGSALETLLDEQLKHWEKQYGIPSCENSLGGRFRDLIRTVSQSFGKRVVILVDEYDKPLLDAMENKALQEHNKEVLKGFFGTLKSYDEYIQFLFISGVSKFHKVSIFSDLNQLRDISMTEDYAALCGITGDEIRTYFMDEVRAMADKLNITEETCLELLKKQYDGYHFNPYGKAVYNPYSLLGAFLDKDFGSYWFETGTPSFLVQKLRESSFDVRRFTDHTIYAAEAVLKDYTGDGTDPVPLLYQTGYLTIADYDREVHEFTLAFPNEEVKYGFIESLMPAYVDDYGPSYGNDIFSLRRYVEQGKTDDIRNVLASLFAGITYTLESDPFEHYFQTIIYLVFTLLGKYTQCEMHTFSGRIDCKVEAKHFIYLFEFKRDGTVDAALDQIEAKDYALPFAADDRTVYKIGVVFDSKLRKLTDWKVL